jgi:hypothetical protein
MAAEAFLEIRPTVGVASEPTMSAATYARICQRFRQHIYSIEEVSGTRFSVRADSDERLHFVAFGISFLLKRLRTHELTEHQIGALRTTATDVIRDYGQCVFITQLSRSVVLAYPRGLRRVKTSPAFWRRSRAGSRQEAGAFIVSYISRYRSVPITRFPHYLSEAIWRYNSRHVPRAVLVKALITAIDPAA